MLIAGTDGSDASIGALRKGLALLPADEALVIAIAIERGDIGLVTGSGMAGGVMTEDEFRATEAASVAEAEDVLRATGAGVERPDAETVVLDGPAGSALCELAAQQRRSRSCSGHEVTAG